jgi:autotransporter-associated beta strand protein
VQGGGSLQLDGTNTYTGATDIAAGTTLTLAAPASTTSGGTTSTTPGGTISGTSALTIASGGTLSLANTDAGNHVIIDYGSGASPNSAVQAYVASGAITTTTGYAVGYADGADGVVSGLSAGQEEIMATLPGDTNLAGTVNLGDVSTVYNNVGITSGATWDQGDFTASGSVTLGDLTSTYNNVGLSLTSGPTISAGTSSGTAAQPIATVMSRTLVANSATSTAPAVTDVTLTVNKATGDAMLVFNNPSAQFYAWEITSTTGGLSYTNLTDIPNFGTGIHARGPTALDGVYSGFATGGYYNPGGTWNLGDIITPSDITSGALDFSFNEFNPSSGLSVTFDPGTINYTAVPEPATLGLLAIGALAMLMLTRRRRNA